MKKKIISGLLAMSLLTTSGSYAFAADPQLTQNGDIGGTKLTKTVATQVTITIPESIQIPNYSETFGSLIDIKISDNSKLGLGQYAKVSLSDKTLIGGQNNFKEGRSTVELKNGTKPIYSPLRLTKMVNGGDIHGPKAQQPDDQSLYKVKTGMYVACYKGNENTGKPEKCGLTEGEYKLYAYRGYMNEDLNDIAGDKDNEIVAGTYEGTVVFQLTIDDTAPGEYGSAAAWEYDVDDMPR